VLAAVAVLLTLGAAFAEATAPTQGPAVNAGRGAPAAGSDREIAFWSARVARDKDDHISATKLGYACLKAARKTGDFRLYVQAEQALGEALKRSPGHYTAVLGLATARAARHRFHEAIALARQASARQPKDAEAWAIIGDAYLSIGNLPKADAAYQELAARASGFVVDTRLANLAHARGKSRHAIALLRDALANAVARDLPADSRAWCHVTIGATLFDLGDWAAAEQEYQAALKLTPESYLAIEHLAELRSFQRRDKEALALYERAITLAAHPDFFEAVGRTHEWAGRTVEARRWYARARDGYLAAVKAGDPGYYRHLAMYFVDVEPKPDEAVSWARKDLELRQDAEAWSTLAWALLAKKDVTGAREANAKATAAGGGDAGLWFRAGMIEKAAGNTPAAKAAFTRALALNPRFDRADEARLLVSQLEGSKATKGRRSIQTVLKNNS
jgi:tetratricopeptide (TPR) repeat protein